MKKSPVIALIQARGGSKGVPKKNIRALGGHPMIAYSIEAAKACSAIDRVIVTTDSEEIADVSLVYGAEVPFLRPAEFASDTATDADVIRHALDWLREHENVVPQVLVQLRPTTPLRHPEVIEAAIAHFDTASDATSLRSAHTMAEPPQKMFRLREDGYFDGFFPDDPRPEYFHLPRQTFPPAFYPNGYVDLISPAFVATAPRHSIYGPRIQGFVTPVAPEVDTPEDFAYLEFLIARNGHPLKDALDAQAHERRRIVEAAQ